MKQTEIPEELRLKGRWAMGESGFNEVLQMIREVKPARIVEFGSGISSIRLAMTFPNVEITSIENSLKFFNEVRALKEKYVPENLLNLKFSPLRFQRYGASFFLTYQPVEVPESVDCVIVDGPPTMFTVRGREACLYQVYNSLRTGGVVIIDDYRRRSERMVVRNWCLTYPDSFEVEERHVGHHFAILKKRTSVAPRGFIWQKAIDNVVATLCIPFYATLYYSYMLGCALLNRIKSARPQES